LVISYRNFEENNIS